MSDGNNTTTVTPADIVALSTYIFDLDGVIWRGSEPVEGAVEAVQRLRAAGKRILYCTNNSSKTPQHYAERLRGMGLELEEEDVLTSSWATAVYLSAQFTGPFSVYVVGEDGVTSALQKTGARIVPEHDVDDDTRVDCVVAGLDRSFNYDRLKIAQQLILRGAQFVATNRDATFPVEDGVLPGSGAIVAAIEAASGTTPVVIGKPRPAMLQLALDRFKIKAEETAMVGDRLDTDMVAARNAGLLALFVATGVTTPVQARKAKGLQRPHALFPNLSALCQVALSEEVAPEASAPAEAASVEETAAENTTVEETTPDIAPEPEETVMSEESTLAEPEEVQSEPEEAATQSTLDSFSFASDAAPEAAVEEEAPSTAAEEESGQIADALADAPVVATPEGVVAADTDTPETVDIAKTEDEEAWDLSELEGIEWADDEKPASNELAKSAPDASTEAPAKALPTVQEAEGGAEENPDDPFASWFEGADEKKSS